MTLAIPATYLSPEGPKYFFITPRRQDEFSDHNIWEKDTSDDLCQLPKITYDVVKYWVNSNVLTRLSQFAKKDGFDVFFQWYRGILVSKCLYNWKIAKM